MKLIQFMLFASGGLASEVPHCTIVENAALSGNLKYLIHCEIIEQSLKTKQIFHRGTGE